MVLAVEQYEIENTYRQEKDEKLLKFLVLFLDKHSFCVHRSYFDFVDMPSLRCEPPKLILRFGEPQPLGSIYLPCSKFDMFSL